ncbi:MAG: ferredoxin--nitrite reductase [Dehalococcoidia bacterium]|nr:MAG: ferredoxin--nitrite reductase [Dehalococcoidia bacterium]
MALDFEEIKATEDGLDVGARIERYASEGWESIPEDDRDARLKWWGVFYRKQTPGLFMMRIRIPNGIATNEQLEALGQIANEFGRGAIDITTRQQVQLRWLRIEDVPEILRRLKEVGLVTLQTGMDNIRNVVGCSAAGVTPNELFDASGVVREFTEIFVGNRAFTNLPRKFNVAITACLDNCVMAETQDLALIPATKEIGGRVLPGFNVLVGGKMGSGGYRIASPLDVFVEPHEAPRVAAEVIAIFRDYGSRQARNRSRFAFLVEEWGEARLRDELEDRLERPLARAGADARNAGTTDHVGVWRQASPGMNYVGLLVPVGRTSGKHFIELARLSKRYGKGEARFTIGQNILVPHVSDKDLTHVLESELLKELPYAPSTFARGTVSCTGKDFCALALIETKTYALDLVAAIEKERASPKRPISVNWSGCPAGCGSHQASDIGFVGRQTRVDGKVIDAVDVYVGGSSGPGAVPGMKVMENVPCTELPKLVGFLSQYGDYQHLHKQLQQLAATPAA